jgi:hypothetical protein
LPQWQRKLAIRVPPWQKYLEAFHRSERFTTFKERGHKQFSSPPEYVWKPGESVDHLVMMETLIHRIHPEAVAGCVGWHINALQI